MTNTIEQFRFQSIPSVADGGTVTDVQLRTLSIDGEPWFITRDVLDVLGLSRSSSSLLDPSDKGVHSVDTPGGLQDYSVINESGLYALILKSRKPEAAVFKRWVTAEVLPTIRKTGAYVDPASELAQKIATGDVEAMMAGFAIALQTAQDARAALVVAEAEKVVLEAKVEGDAPFVKAAIEFFDEEAIYSLRDSARKLGVPPLTFNDILRSWGWIDESSTAAKSYSVSNGFAVNRVWMHPGSGAATTQGRLTNKGIERAAIKLQKEGTWTGYAKV
ncbi:hypothetical protein ASE48_08565 [Mycobacterium sp. Root265]|uniref:BRO family protein n=1 Tax=Mycobacterium sp. Root265 TaxID=1736504 RepID=UPI0007108013|nr:BRO family protein [Mycobacterium sp. Root265]KRD08607.1 hypothetical protein ASE48_08565 [Mycobacterium sp. Root265]